MSTVTTARALAVAVAAFVVGLAGAWAFNPDDGALVQSEPLWRVFGLMAYVAIPALWVIVAVLVLRALMALARRARRS